ncbi:MAG: polysaccharide biosynthesis tyrosine autokinase [Gloeomargaritaceae cyanobacterium C42_A2020_066]|nr:polysaccharide biosynthesis tyrosine autokinase [Gloeomargaritaceae cyanobacterium C42_A2020_066]
MQDGLRDDGRLTRGDRPLPQSGTGGLPYTPEGTAPQTGSSVNLLSIIQKRWPIILIVGLPIFGLSALRILSTPPIYTSRSAILLGASSTSSQIIGVRGIEGDLRNKDYSTQIQILTSTPLLADAIEIINKTDPELKPDINKISNKLVVRQVGTSDVLTVSYTDGNPKVANRVVAALTEVYVGYSLTNQQSRVRNALKFIDDQLPKAQASLDRVSEKLEQFAIQNRLINVETSAGNAAGVRAERTATIQAQTIELKRRETEYQEISRQLVQLGRDPSQHLRDTVLSQDPGYAQLLSQLQAAELQYDIERIRYQDGAPPLEALRDRRDKLRQLVNDRIKAVTGSAPTSTNSAKLPPSSVADVAPGLAGSPIGLSAPAGAAPTSPTASSGIGSFVPSFTVPSNGSTTATAQAAGQTSQNQYITQLQARLSQLQAEIAIQKAYIATLQATEAALDAEIRRIPGLQREFAELQRQYQINSTIVNTLLSRAQELTITEAGETAPWQVLEPASLPLQPTPQDHPRKLILSLLGGLLAGLGVAYLLERMDRRIRSVDEAKELLKLPLFGVLPFVRTEVLRSLPDADGTEQQQDVSFRHFREAVRSLVLSLRYAGPSQDVRCVVLSSALPSEGKSTVSQAVAEVMAEWGLRVLLVDADMRQPKQHKLYGLPNATGLSTIIATDQAWTECTNSFVGGRLHVITAGPPPPNPSVLLYSSRMKTLVEEWRAHYDYVLIDSPPLVGMTDATSISLLADGILLVVSTRRPNRDAIVNVVEELRISQVNVLGFALNQVDMTSDRYYQYYAYSSRYYGAIQSPLVASTSESTSSNS